VAAQLPGLAQALDLSMKRMAIWLLVLAAAACSRHEGTAAGAPHTFELTKPDFSVQAFGGKLLGFDHGEWGGKLVFDKGGKAVDVLNENVKAIVPMEQGVLVFTGLSHLSTNDGYIYLLEQAGSSFSLTGLQRLDGSPEEIRPIPPNQSVYFRVFTGKLDMRTQQREWIYQCQSIDRSFNVRPAPCASIR